MHVVTKATVAGLLIAATAAGCMASGGMGDRVDAGSRERDANVASGPDASVAEDAARTDSGAIAVDAAHAEDSGAMRVDAASALVDSGTASFEDAASSADDAATMSLVDAGSVAVDAGRDASVSIDASAAIDAATGVDAAALADAAHVDAGRDAAVAVDASVTPDAGMCVAGDAMAADARVNAVAPFAAGASLPAGMYAVQYEDGCMKYNGGFWWSVNAITDGSAAWWLVGATSATQVHVLPGTYGCLPGTATTPEQPNGFMSFDDCVAANLALPPLVFMHTGGPLGVWLEDSNYFDNANGTSGRNPRWRLTRLDCDASP